MAPGSPQPNDRDRRAQSQRRPGLQRINLEERRLSPGLSISLSIRILSTSHRHHRGAGEQQNSVEGPLFGNLSKTASSVAREASPRPAAASRRVLDPDLAPIARPLGGDLEAGLGCNAIGPQPQGQSLLTPGSRTAAPSLLSKRQPALPPAPAAPKPVFELEDLYREAALSKRASGLSSGT